MKSNTALNIQGLSIRDISTEELALVSGADGGIPPCDGAIIGGIIGGIAGGPIGSIVGAIIGSTLGCD